MQQGCYFSLGVPVSVMQHTPMPFWVVRLARSSSIVIAFGLTTYLINSWLALLHFTDAATVIASYFQAGAYVS